jgi:CxxC motif-containing protein (DUF1111 family)
MHGLPRAAALASLLAPPFLAACHGSLSEPAASRPEPGGPIAGLTRAERAAFERGKLVFQRRFAPEDGLGPRYNATSCEGCHSEPALGGSAPLYRNFYVGMSGVPGRQTPLPGFGSAVVQSFGGGDDFSTERGRPRIDEAGAPMTLAQRNALPLFGVGLFEFVSDATILQRADPNDVDGDGIRGRFNTDAGAIGRFGVKAQANNIEAFTRAPLMNQLGITSDPFLGTNGIVSLGSFHPPQVSSDPNRPTTDLDPHPDPEISARDLGDLIAFTRFLAPVQPLQPFGPAATRGRKLFDELGCARCHVPELASSRGPVRAYTDLLLHDLGDALADGLAFGVPQPAALAPPTSAGEFRTQPLWGVSLSAPFLHDGRAETLEEAIELHGGEAQRSRDAFLARPPEEQADLIAFLEHL